MIVEDVSRVRVDEGSWELSARVRTETSAVVDGRLGFRVSGAAVTPADDDPVDASPFVPALLLAAMLTGEGLEIDGSVSPRLIGGAVQAMAVYRNFYGTPGRPLELVTLEATTREPAPAPDARAAFFTGGLDSWFTALTRPVDALITVPSLHHRAEPGVRRRWADETRASVETLGIRGITVETNWVELLAPIVVTNKGLGAVLAAVGLAVGIGFREVLISAGVSLAIARRNHSHPVLDALWSTERTEIVHDRPELNRLDKARVLASSPRALDRLKVCMRSVDGNCGRCEKCLRTMVVLQLAGATTTRFPPLRTRDVARMQLQGHVRQGWAQIEPWLAAGGDADRRVLAALRIAYLRDDLRQLRRDAERVLRRDR